MSGWEVGRWGAGHEMSVVGREDVGNGVSSGQDGGREFQVLQLSLVRAAADWR